MTKEHLQNAFSGESQAYMRYQIYADVAEGENHPNVARLFKAIAFAERVHATNHLELLPLEEAESVAPTSYGVGDTLENLQAGIDGETFEIEEMYPTYEKVAQFQEEKSAVITFHWALQAEKTHAIMYKEAKQTLEAGKDYDLGPIQVCRECGYTIEGEAPDPCPICGAKAKKFNTFD